ncbi:DUF1684 domain-containing protein [Epilithonimonas sp.]|uniref:DUF1684 domain-containing protein n=1 Tax=Epilithonimonas sp. TaxID=2894511 RepID=UPI0035ADFE23
MKKLSLLFIILSLFLNAQTEKDNIAAIRKFRKELSTEYRDPKETPLRGDNLKNFKKHPFFPIHLKYRVIARLTKTENPVPFELPTSSGKFQKYREYGKAEFEIDGTTYVLTIYQNLRLIEMEKYKDHLFLPFRDETNGKETYGGGKYMDLKTPSGNEIVLDFNQSYQPFCAYNAFDYNCPIVPEENKLPIRIEAGVMYEDVYHH